MIEKISKISIDKLMETKQGRWKIRKIIFYSSCVIYVVSWVLSEIDGIFDPLYWFGITLYLSVILTCVIYKD